MPNTPDKPKRPDVEGIKARAKAATKGPWIEGQPGNFRIYGPANMGRQSGPLVEGLGVNDNEILRANVSFIAHARQDIPALIAYIKALEARKWDVKHTDTMNDMVALGIDRDSWKARVEALEAHQVKLEVVVAPFVKFIESADGLVALSYAQGKGEKHPAIYNGVPDDIVLLRPSPEVYALTLGHFRALAGLDGGDDG